MCDAPKVLMQAASIIWLISGIIFLVGSLIWFPRFLLPPWYRRAVKAGSHTQHRRTRDKTGETGIGPANRNTGAVKGG